MADFVIFPSYLFISQEDALSFQGLVLVLLVWLLGFLWPFMDLPFSFLVGVFGMVGAACYGTFLSHIGGFSLSQILEFVFVWI